MGGRVADELGNQAAGSCACELLFETSHASSKIAELVRLSTRRLAGPAGWPGLERVERRLVGARAQGVELGLLDPEGAAGLPARARARCEREELAKAALRDATAVKARERVGR